MIQPLLEDLRHLTIISRHGVKRLAPWINSAMRKIHVSLDPSSDIKQACSIAIEAISEERKQFRPGRNEKIASVRFSFQPKPVNEDGNEPSEEDLEAFSFASRKGSNESTTTTVIC